MIAPLSLYIHIPWCIRKCPYCDFNSYQQQGELAEKAYVDTLIRDLTQHESVLKLRPIQTIFIGGGTPSLFTAESIAALLSRIRDHAALSDTCEMTLEANPGTFEQARFTGYFDAGINRLSIGVQSFQDEKLTALGRVHQASEALQAIEGAKAAGFERINVDLMHGLPHQSKADALFDLQTAMDTGITHISWYQLTLEPNTVFAKFPPSLPEDEALWAIQAAGENILADHGFQHYETSAFCKANQQARHNLNYWQFGDYIGIGAGAHSKLTHHGMIQRFQKKRSPKDYLSDPSAVHIKTLSHDDIVLESMMNVLRLTEGVPVSVLEAHTGLRLKSFNPGLEKVITQGFVTCEDGRIQPTLLGRRFLNECLGVFCT